MMRALIVDDEVHARRSLEAMLERTGEFAVVGRCGNAVEALHAIRAEKPDVLFLDVQMPKVNGLQLLSMIDPEIMPHVVFVTAYDEFAVKAFEENALDYLLKPVQKDRFAKTVDKLRRALGEAPAGIYDGPPIERIPCLGTNSIRLVDLADVEYVHSGAAGVYVVTTRGEHFTELTLQVLEAKTPLVRCHKQFLVNVRQVEHIIREGPRETVLRTRSGKDVPVSRRFFPKLKEQLGLRL